ncbi:hypothetical protein Aduo_018677 [Ancylostoma duodenale]
MDERFGAELAYDSAPLIKFGVDTPQASKFCYEQLWVAVPCLSEYVLRDPPVRPTLREEPRFIPSWHKPRGRGAGSEKKANI